MTPAEIEAQMTACQTIENTAHQMAECARQLGYPEDHTIIKCAQEKWWSAFNKETELAKQLSEMMDNTGPTVPPTTWTGSRLTKRGGVNYGPTGKETYYNLNMSGVVRIMRNMGYSESEYPYWVRNDGVKMLGQYVMLAGRIGQYDRGTIIPCSLGVGIICDYGYLEWNAVDVAVTWR